MFNYTFTLRLHHTDAAGVIFFANLFTIAHDCYEEFLDKNGFPINIILRDEEIIIPISGCFAEYLKPMRASDEFIIRMVLIGMKDSRFELHYDFLNQNSEIAAKVTTRHIILKKKDFKEINIPLKLKSILGSLNN